VLGGRRPIGRAAQSGIPPLLFRALDKAVEFAIVINASTLCFAILINAIERYFGGRPA